MVVLVGIVVVVVAIIGAVIVAIIEHQIMIGSVITEAIIER